MTILDYQNWVEPRLKLFDSKSRSLFKEAIRLADRLPKPRMNISHHLESSLDNIQETGLIKVIHVFRYPYFEYSKSSCDFINSKILLNFLQRINRICNLNFNLGLLKPILSIPLKKENKNSIIVVYFEYDLKKRSFSKFSFHINPARTAWLSELLKTIKNINRKEISHSISEERIEFLGFDFFEDGSQNWKIYQRFKTIPRNINFLKEANKRLLKEIDYLRKKKDSLLMHRFDASGYLDALPAIYLYHDRTPDYKDLLCLKSIRNFKRFIEKSRDCISNFDIIWTALKNNSLEFYFR